MKEQLSSGATIDATIAPVTLGFKLLQTCLKEFKKGGLDYDFKADDDISSVTDIFVKNPNKFLAGLVDVIASPEVMDLIMQCGNSAVYCKNGVSQRVSWEVFEDENCRGDFLEVLKVIAEKNLKCFFPKARMK